MRDESSPPLNRTPKGTSAIKRFLTLSSSDFLTLSSVVSVFSFSLNPELL